MACAALQGAVWFFCRKAAVGEVSGASQGTGTVRNVEVSLFRFPPQRGRWLAKSWLATARLGRHRRGSHDCQHRVQQPVKFPETFGQVVVLFVQ